MYFPEYPNAPVTMNVPKLPPVTSRCAARLTTRATPAGEARQVHALVRPHGIEDRELRTLPATSIRPHRVSLTKASPIPVRYTGPRSWLIIAPVMKPGSGAQTAGVNNSIREVPDWPRRPNSSITAC